VSTLVAICSRKVVIRCFRLYRSFAKKPRRMQVQIFAWHRARAQSAVNG
jgi:hypothetical protein